MSKYVVTGAAGFIGAHLTRLLSSRGHEVVAVDNGIHANAAGQFAMLRALPGVEVRELDLALIEEVRTLPEVDGVYHLAALNGTQNFYTNPWKTVRNSTLPTLTLLEHYGEHQPEFFFYAGSSEAYAGTVTRFGWNVPTEEAVPLTIDDPRQVRWSYGASKLHGEVACFAAQAETGLPVVVGRFHNAYGPDMGIHHVIPDFVDRGRRGVFELYGASQTRSFIYIDDAVNAVTVVADRAHGEVVNIGSPVEISMRDLAKVIMSEAGWSGGVVEFDAPAGSVERRAPDVTKLNTYVDTSEFVSLQEGVRRTLASMGL
jgi:UDP-glucose 4-epimerase